MHNSAQLRCFENGNDDFGVEAFWIGDAARVGYFVPLNGSLNGHPPSNVLKLYVLTLFLIIVLTLLPRTQSFLTLVVHFHNVRINTF